jgi:hypothetical protein
MSSVPSAQLLDAWERGQVQPPARRALTLLGMGCDDEAADKLANLTIGERDARLLSLREQVFGAFLNATADCPACDETLAVNFKAADVRVESTGQSPPGLTLEYGNYVVAFRLPQACDLTTLEQDAPIVQNRQHLLERCTLSARCGTEEISAADLPDNIVAAIATRMAEADPQADILIALQCPQCAHRWRVPLDILSFFWTELTAWATRLLREVHALASAYGWREIDILALSSTRRQLYLEMIGS